VAKAGDEGRRFPMSMRDAGAQPLALRGAPALARVESRYLVERNEYESVGLFRPELADELVGVRPLSVFRRRTQLYAVTKLARCVCSSACVS
jgi:hypothetical protein